MASVAEAIPPKNGWPHKSSQRDPVNCWVTEGRARRGASSLVSPRKSRLGVMCRGKSTALAARRGPCASGRRSLIAQKIRLSIMSRHICRAWGFSAGFHRCNRDFFTGVVDHCGRCDCLEKHGVDRIKCARLIHDLSTAERVAERGTCMSFRDVSSNVARTPLTSVALSLRHVAFAPGFASHTPAYERFREECPPRLAIATLESRCEHLIAGTPLSFS